MHDILLCLLIVLIVLKFFGLIALSWMWVLAPFWSPLILALVCLAASLVWYRIFGSI